MASTPGLRSRAERRLDRRIVIPAIRLAILSDIYTTRDWSLGGFRIKDYPVQVPTGEILPVTIVMSAGEKVFRHAVMAEVVRTEPGSGELAATFTRLTPDAVTMLEAALAGRLRDLAESDR